MCTGFKLMWIKKTRLISHSRVFVIYEWETEIVVHSTFGKQFTLPFILAPNYTFPSLCMHHILSLFFLCFLLFKNQKK